MQAASLSFGIEDDEENEEDAAPLKKRKFGKDPSIDTEFLPDREREAKVAAQRQALKEEWISKQAAIKGS